MSKQFFPWLSLLVLGTLTGCGTGSYDQALNQRVAEARQSAPYRALYQGGTDIPDTNRTVRLPQLFKSAYQANSPHPVDGASIDPRRLQPPFLELPGFKVCYETTYRDGADNCPYYCYLAARPLAPEDRAGLEADLLDKVKATFPAAVWTPVDVKSPEGTTVPWKKISVSGDQLFLYGNPGDVQPKTIPGTFELWLHEGEAGAVLIGWRWPSQIADKISVENVKLADLPELTASTLATKPAAEAPADAQPAAAQ